MLSDEQLADSVTRSFRWKRNWRYIKPGDRPRELMGLVYSCLKDYEWIPPEDFGRRWVNVVAILRHRFSMTAVETKRVRAEAEKKRVEEKAEEARRANEEPTLF